MKTYIPTNWGWYVATFIILGPFLFISFIEPDWLGRLIGLSFFFGIPPIIAFLYAFGPRKNLTDIAHRKNLWPQYIIKRIGERGVDIVTKVLCLIAGMWIVLFMSLPFARDVLFIIDNAGPKEKKMHVVENQGSSVAGFVFREVVVDSYPSGTENTFRAWYFSPRYIMQGKTYEFLYLPNTHIILDAKSVSE